MADQTVTARAALSDAVAFVHRAAPLAWAPMALVAVLAFMPSPALHLAPVWLVAVALLNLPVSAVANGALMRIALEDRHAGEADFRLGPAGLQWGVIETKLLWSLLLLGLFFVLCIIGAVFLFGLVAIVVAAVSGAPPRTPAGLFASPSGVFGGLAFAIAVLLMFWAAARLILATPATADRRSVQVFSTWELTRGQVVKIAAAMIVIGLPALILNQAARLFADGGPALVTALWGLYALVVGLVQTPLVAGAAASFYRRLGDGAAVAGAEPAAHNRQETAIAANGQAGQG